jgi:hypothetical protein
VVLVVVVMQPFPVPPCLRLFSAMCLPPRLRRRRPLLWRAPLLPQLEQFPTIAERVVSLRLHWLTDRLLVGRQRTVGTRASLS